MSLQIQNGEHVRSHFAAQSERRATEQPTWGSCAVIGYHRYTPLENPIGQSTTLSRQSGPRVSAQSVCGTANGGGTGYTQQQASGICHNGRHFQKKNHPFVRQNIFWTYLGDSSTNTGSNLDFL